MSSFTSILGNNHSQPGNIELGLSPVVQFSLGVTGSASVQAILSAFLTDITGTASVSPKMAVSLSLADSILGVSSALFNLHRNRSASASIVGAGTFVFFEFGGFGVASATSSDPTDVIVQFDSFLDFTYTQVLSKFNYSINGLDIRAVYQNTSTSVRLVTSVQSATTYTVVVTSARGIYGQMMDPNPIYHTANFPGMAPSPTVRGRAVSSTKVRVLYSTQMLNNSNLSNVANYSVTDLAGNAFTILSATPEQPINPESVALVLASALNDTGLYKVTVSSVIQSVGGQSVSPGTSIFEWYAEVGPIEIGFDVFSGEVSGGLLGSPDGQVFFSPALNTPIGNSVIQVDEVDVCSIASDSYVFPVPVDPPLMFTFQPGQPAGFSALGACALWAPFPRLNEVQFEISSSSAGPFAQDHGHSVTDAVTIVLQPDGNPQQFTVLSQPITGSGSFVAVPS